MTCLCSVCQEAIWEAFRVFLDRVPNSEEYSAWLYTCQHENLCMDSLALNFSQSQEHLDLVARVSLMAANQLSVFNMVNRTQLMILHVLYTLQASRIVNVQEQ